MIYCKVWFVPELIEDVGEICQIYFSVRIAEILRSEICKKSPRLLYFVF